MVKTKNISISDEEEKFLVENPDLSPSKIFQSALHNIKESRKDYENRVIRIDKVRQELQKHLFIATELIKELGAIKEYEKRIAEEM